MNRFSMIRTAVAVAAALVAGNSMAQASGAARVTNTGYGYYSAFTQLKIEIGGTPIGSYNSYDYFLNRYKQNFGSSATAVAAPVVISDSSAGNAITSPYTVNVDVRAGTTWGTNRTYASVSGFEYLNTTSTSTLCTTVPGTGTCVPGLPEQTQTLNTSNQAYGGATSRWEEIYQTGGADGALSTTFNIHVSLGAQPGAAGAAPSGQSSFFWAERDFNGNNTAYFSASYSASSDTWWAQAFSNDTGLRSYYGSGSFAVGSGQVLTSWDGSSTFDGTLTGTRSFTTGDVVYVDSYAQSYVQGNGLSDAENTVTLTNLNVSDGVRVLAQSGTNYGGVFTGGGGGGGLCTDLSCVGGGGGGGGGTPPIPEPGTYALLLACLGVVGWSVRRRRNA